jgi:hypothetical protein
MTYADRTHASLSILAGQENGRLPDELLVDTPGRAGGPVVRLVEPAARAWRAMAADAAKAGHILKATSLVDSYRPYDVQRRIFLERFTTSPVSSTRRWWLGRWWYLRPGYALAAVPGTSSHGWARAVDAGEERDGDTGTESLDAATLAWLLDNEERFGFYHEVDSEPWHLTYFAGDVPPRAVLDYEASLKPAPTPPEDDDLTPEQAAQLGAVHMLTASIHARLTALEAKVAHLDPFAPERHNGNGDISSTGVPSAKQNRWLSETVRRLRDAHIGDGFDG